MLQMGYKHHIVGGKRHEQYRNLNTLNPSPLPHFIWSYFGWVTEWLRYSDIGVNDGGLMGWWTPSSLQRLDFQYLTLQWSDKWRDSRSTCPLCNWKTIHFCKRTACLCSCQHDLNLAAAKLLQEMISIISDSLAYCSSLEGCPYLLSPRPFAPSVQQWPGHLGQHGKKKNAWAQTVKQIVFQDQKRLHGLFLYILVEPSFFAANFQSIWHCSAKLAKKRWCCLDTGSSSNFCWPKQWNQIVAWLLYNWQSIHGHSSLFCPLSLQLSSSPLIVCATSSGVWEITSNTTTGSAFLRAYSSSSCLLK